jgi:branched-chain amino acid transport system ATP-binding protein
MLVLKNVDAHYGKSHVLHGVSIEVRAGEVVGLLGRNGVGKTTTLKTIMGMARRTGGRITFEGRDLHGVPPHGLAGLGIAWVPEERRIFRLLTVLENLRTGLDRAGMTPARHNALLEKMRRLPILKERRNQAGGTFVRRRAADPPALPRDGEPSEDHPARRADRGAHASPVGQIRRSCARAPPRGRGTHSAGPSQNADALTLDAARRVYIMEKGTVRAHASAAELRRSTRSSTGTWGSEMDRSSSETLTAS